MAESTRWIDGNVAKLDCAYSRATHKFTKTQGTIH